MPLLVPKPLSAFSQAVSARSGDDTSPVCAPQPSSQAENSLRAMLTRDAKSAIGLAATRVCTPMRVHIEAIACRIGSSFT